MAILDINTDRLVSASDALFSANQEIDEAMFVLMSITEHNDWHCPERGEINSQIRSHKEKMKQLQERMNRFTVVCKEVSQSFVDKEKNIAKMFESLDELLNSVLGIGSGGGGSIISSISAISSTAAGISSIIAKIKSLLLKPIRNIFGTIKPSQIIPISGIKPGFNHIADLVKPSVIKPSSKVINLKNLML